MRPYIGEAWCRKSSEFVATEIARLRAKAAGGPSFPFPSSRSSHLPSVGAAPVDAVPSPVEGPTEGSGHALSEGDRAPSDAPPPAVASPRGALPVVASSSALAVDTPAADFVADAAEVERVHPFHSFLCSLPTFCPLF